MSPEQAHRTTLRARQQGGAVSEREAEQQRLIREIIEVSESLCGYDVDLGPDPAVRPRVERLSADLAKWFQEYDPPNAPRYQRATLAAGIPAGWKGDPDYYDELGQILVWVQGADVVYRNCRARAEADFRKRLSEWTTCNEDWQSRNRLEFRQGSPVYIRADKTAVGDLYFWSKVYVGQLLECYGSYLFDEGKYGAVAVQEFHQFFEEICDFTNLTKWIPSLQSLGLTEAAAEMPLGFENLKGCLKQEMVSRFEAAAWEAELSETDNALGITAQWDRNFASLYELEPPNTDNLSKMPEPPQTVTLPEPERIAQEAGTLSTPIRRGRPVTIPEQCKKDALDARERGESNKEQAKLYSTTHPTRRQQADVSNVLKQYCRKTGLVFE